MSIKTLASQHGFRVVARADDEKAKAKYELTEKTKNVGGRTLYRIVALDDITVNQHLTVHEGELGGFIESEKNLSQVGNAWVDGSACVWDDAVVSEKAWIHGEARISGTAQVKGRAQVRGNVVIKGSAVIKDDVKVYGKVVVSGSTVLSGNVDVGGSFSIEDLKIKGDDKIRSAADLKKFEK